MQIDVMTQVRSGYFAVLVAYDNLTIAKAMSQLSDEVYSLQIKMVQGGVAAAYEPLQLRVLAEQARGNLIQARNRYISAWRQLAASLSQPDMPPMQLAGHAEAVAPGYAYDVVRAYILANHTDIGIASNGIQKSRLLLQLERVTPVPDILTHFVVQNDNTSQPNRVQAGVQVGFRIPVFDANQGNILQAQAQLAKSNQEIPRVENELMQRLADAYERYRNNLTLAAYYRDSVLPNQVRVYRAIWQRYEQQPDKVQYSDIVVAQQTLAQALQTYVQTLAAQWQAIVDLGALMQTDDLYQLTVPHNPKDQAPAPAPVAALLDSRSWSTAAAPRIQVPPTPASPPAATPWPRQQVAVQPSPQPAPPPQNTVARRPSTPELPPPPPSVPTRATLAAPVAVENTDLR
jgi:cobalt-zinc-cadmium efflux system outer membrane protein